MVGSGSVPRERSETTSTGIALEVEFDLEVVGRGAPAELDVECQ